jgi:enoyl-CoA hydratase/carnithine racemase
MMAHLLNAAIALRAGTIGTMPAWMRELSGPKQSRLVDGLITPILKVSFRVANTNAHAKVLLVGLLSPMTRPVVAPILLGIPPTNPEILTPSEARERYGYDKPSEAHLGLRERQAQRVFGEHLAPSDEGIIESQAGLGAAAAVGASGCLHELLTTCQQGRILVGMAYEEILYSVEDRIATITLNRPLARNGYTVKMADELGDALTKAGQDDDVQVVVLTGAGDNFCVGADLSGGELKVAEGSDGSDWVEPATRATRPMFNLEKPVIAAIRGAAVGVGSTMILPADYRIASTDSRFGFVFSRRGLYPEGGSTWFLPRLVGMGKASDWMISGRIIPADEALAAGLVSALCAPDEVLDRAYELARELIATTAPVSTAVIRQALFRMSALDSPEGAFLLDSQLIGGLGESADAMEGVISFLEKRPPEFTATVSKGQPDFLPWHR